MRETTDIHLTDKQYLELLKAGRARLDKIDKVTSHDSEDIGNKYTESNVGLCDDSLTTKDNAMWPEQFPGRLARKYKQKHHKCPLDPRPDGEYTDGCFYECLVFQGKVKDISRIKKLYDDKIDSIEVSKLVKHLDA
jgi:hypothetical protein